MIKKRRNSKFVLEDSNLEMDLVEGFSNELTYWQRIDAIIFVGRRPGCTQ